MTFTALSLFGLDSVQRLIMLDNAAVSLLISFAVLDLSGEGCWLGRLQSQHLYWIGS